MSSRGLATSEKRFRWLAVAATTVGLALATPASAGYTLDRVYRLGDDDNDNGVPSGGVAVGNTTSTGDTFDSQGTPGTRTLIDLTPNGGPVYASVTGRPQLVGSGLGVAFDGLNDYLTGFRLGLPATSVSSLGSTQNNPNDPTSDLIGTLDYASISNRGFQFWVRPSSIGQGRDQSLVLDSAQHGVRITASNRWSLRYGGSDVESALSVGFDAWHHVMLVRPFGGAGGARMYVDGNIVAFAPGDYDGGDANYLTLGASTGDLADGVSGNEPGSAEFFTGIIDDLDMFVLGLSPTTQYGTFALAADHKYIANRMTGKPLGDVNLDGTTNQTDVNLFVAHWFATKTVNGRVLGDLETRLNGDFNLDGVVDVFDAIVLHKGLLAAGHASGLDFSRLGTAGVPEPSTAGLCLCASAVLTAAGRGRRRRPCDQVAVENRDGATRTNAR